MQVLVTGGAGYIGSHTVLELLNSGNKVTVVDNLSNSSDESLKRVMKLTGKQISFHNFDLRDKSRLAELFDANSFDAVIHFAALKAVGESIEKPMDYYDNNLASTFALLEQMSAHGVKKIIFSSSATVYGSPTKLPLTEKSPVGIGLTNPYGKTKYMIEQILEDCSAASAELEVTILRYFNPVGAHESGQIGEDPSGIPNNLLPFVSQVAIGMLEKLRVFGDDYNTPDGTCIRDFIHVVDLAKGHLAALEHSNKGVAIYNLGTGRGTSVLELISAFEKASGKNIPYEIVGRRTGDIESCYADPAKANSLLGWKAEKDIDTACEDSWKWQQQNPSGYSTAL